MQPDDIGLLVVIMSASNNNKNRNNKRRWMIKTNTTKQQPQQQHRKQTAAAIACTEKIVEENRREAYEMDPIAFRALLVPPSHETDAHDVGVMTTMMTSTGRKELLYIVYEELPDYSYPQTYSVVLEDGGNHDERKKLVLRGNDDDGKASSYPLVPVPDHYIFDCETFTHMVQKQPE